MADPKSLKGLRKQSNVDTCPSFKKSSGHIHSLTPRSQLVAVDVILKHGLLHMVTDHCAEGTHSVTLFMLLQLVWGNARETLLAVTTHQ